MNAIVASTAIPLTPEVVGAVLAIVGTSDAIGVRAPRHGGPASAVEEMAWTICRQAGRTLAIYRPQEGIPNATFARDYRMVGESAKVFAFFNEGHVMTGGTGHVVRVALQQGVPVEAYEVASGGVITYIGSNDLDQEVIPF